MFCWHVEQMYTVYCYHLCVTISSKRETCNTCNQVFSSKAGFVNFTNLQMLVESSCRYLISWIGKKWLYLTRQANHCGLTRMWYIVTIDCSNVRYEDKSAGDKLACWVISVYIIIRCKSLNLPFFELSLNVMQLKYVKHQMQFTSNLLNDVKTIRWEKSSYS